jgi:uncharacterized peroxidase-related enzyme
MALCHLAVKLTHKPAEMGQEDVDELRGHGWSDAAIHDAFQVISYFNYINRIAGAVGIEDEPDWEPEEPK